MRAPEILSPVGTWDMLRAAVHNGADAVYIGMPGFNARGRAATLELDELKAMIDYAHLYGVKVFLAFNILIFERELSDVIDALEEVLPLRPDAFIVQDIGLVKLIRAMAPEQSVHASTQMTITSSEAIDLTEDLGMARYVLGREVSIPQMAEIRKSTTKELEVFVHGALCVSYSGQCLTSESLGGRSANRGQCAQSCRLGYDLIVDGKRLDMGPRQYLVSPQDLCGLDDVPQLVELGIDSFKIEGRLKSPEYVGSTARSYKDRSLGHLPDSDARRHSGEMARLYSRGFFNGWFDGVNHQKLVNPLISSHVGIRLGTIKAVERDSVVVESADPIAAGDGIVFKEFSHNVSVGATVFQAARERGGTWRLSFDRAFSLSQLSPGCEVYLNSSPHLEAEVRQSFSDKHQLKRIPLHMTVRGQVGSPLSVSALDPDGNTAVACSAAMLEPAARAPLSHDSAAQELGALGGTVFSLEDVSFEVSGSCFIHNRELKEIRRSLCAQLTEQRISRKAIAIMPGNQLRAWMRPIAPPAAAPSIPSLNVLVRSVEQLSGLSALPLDTVYLDFEFGKEYSRAAEEVRAMGYKVGIATTRILKPGETSHLKVIERIKPDSVLVRNLGALQWLRHAGVPLVGDFSLNVTNSLTAGWFLSKGLSRLSPSYDLNSEQLLDLARATEASRLEITAHHYIPAFHMEHCVFAAFLSSGSSYRDCGRPCEKHRVELRDQRGALHPLKADAECRNTMFNGVPQSAAKLIPELLRLGVTTFRVEALFEDAQALREKVAAYATLLRGDIGAESVVAKLGIKEKFGVTDGQLYNIRAYRDRKKEFTSLAALSPSADPGLAAIVANRQDPTALRS